MSRPCWGAGGVVWESTGPLHNTGHLGSPIGYCLNERTWSWLRNSGTSGRWNGRASRVENSRCKCPSLCRTCGGGEDTGVACTRGKEALAGRLGQWVLMALKGGPRTGLALGAQGGGVGRGLREACWGGGWGWGGGLRLGGLERLICRDRGSGLCGAVPPLPAGHRRQFC